MVTDLNNREMVEIRLELWDLIKEKLANDSEMTNWFKWVDRRHKSIKEEERIQSEIEQLEVELF
jgi:hypothetical protein